MINTFERDLKIGKKYEDEVLKLISGFGISKADPYQSMRFKLGKYSGEIGSAKAAFTGDTVNATK